LTKPLDNSYFGNSKDLASVRISFCKSVYGTKYVAILGAMGQPGNTIKILNEKGDNLGVYKVLDSTTGNVLKKYKNQLREIKYMTFMCLMKKFSFKN